MDEDEIASDLDPEALVDPETGEPYEEAQEPETEPIEAQETDPQAQVQQPAQATQPVQRGAEARAAIERAATTVEQQSQQRGAAASPYAAPVLTDQERQDAELLFDEKQLAFIERLTQRSIDRALSAHDQQYAEARRLGVSDDFMREYGDDIRRFTPNVPQHMRGTREGAYIALQMAVADRAMNGGNAPSEWRKAADLWEGKKAQPAPAPAPRPAPKQPVQPIPAAAVVSRGVPGAGAAPAGVKDGTRREPVSRRDRALNRLYASLGATELRK